MALIAKVYNFSVFRDIGFEREKQEEFAGLVKTFPLHVPQKPIIVQGIRSHFAVCYGFPHYERFNGIAGAEFTITKTNSFVEWFKVDADKIGQGYGKQLYNIVESFLKTNGIRTIRLSSLELRKDFWRRRGFKEHIENDGIKIYQKVF